MSTRALTCILPVALVSSQCGGWCLGGSIPGWRHKTVSVARELSRISTAFYDLDCAVMYHHVLCILLVTDSRL